MVFSKDDKILIKTLRESKDDGEKGLLRNFRTRTGTKWDWIICLKKLRETGTAERTIGSGRRRSSRTTQNIDAVEDLRRETPDFISPDLWPPNSLDLNPDLGCHAASCIPDKNEHHRRTESAAN